MAPKDNFFQINRETPINAKKALEVVGELQKKGGQVNDIGGVFALTLMNKFGINPKKEKTLDGLKDKLIAHGKDSLDKAQNKFDKKAEEIGKSVAKKLNGDEKLEKLVTEESKKIIKGEEVISTKDLTNDLQRKLAKVSGVEMNDKSKVVSNEAVKAVRKWEVENIEEAREIKRENFKQKFRQEYEDKNPGITKEQLQLVDDGADLVSDIFYTGKGVENTRDEVLAGVGLSGNINQAWTDIEGTIKLLQKTPEQIKDIKGKYEIIKNGLSGLNQPTNIRELTSFNSLIGALKNEGVMESFNLGQSEFLSWVDRFDTFSGGAIRRATANWGGKFISNIGTESTKVFLENGLKVFAEKGFQQGFNAVLKSFLSGGTTTAAGGAVAGGAAAGGVAVGGAAAAGPPGWIIAAAAILGGILKKSVEKLKSKGLGKRMVNAINGFEFGGSGKSDGDNKLIKKKWFWILIVSLAIFLMLIITFVALISSMVSPVDEEKAAEYAGEHNVNILKDFKIPTCRPNGKYPNGNDRAILRDIALSIEGKVVYSQISDWRVVGASKKWNTKVPESYDWAREGGKYLYDEKGNHVIDSDRAAKRAMYPYYGLDCGSFAAWVWYQCAHENWHYPNLVDWNAAGEKTEGGLDRIFSESVDDLKIGDVFYRSREESLDWCKDKETGEEAGCTHYALYIGNGEVMESVGRGGDPARTTIWSVKPIEVRLKRDHSFAKYPHTYRINDVFLD